VILSSVGYNFGEMKWNDMMLERDFDAAKAYSNSKLANVLHCLELSRRLEGTLLCLCILQYINLIVL